MSSAVTMKSKRTPPIPASDPDPPPARADASWSFEGWKAAVNRITTDERHRAAIINDVNAADKETTRRRGMGQGGKPHPLSAVGRTLAGLSSRVQRSGREPIRAGEMAEICRSIAGLDELVAAHGLASAAAEAMVEDARRAIEPADDSPAPAPAFGNPVFYLKTACEALGLPAAFIARAVGVGDLPRLASRLSTLQSRLRRSPNGAFRPEMPEIRAELDLASREATKLGVVAEASAAMLAECRAALGIEPPASPVRPGPIAEGDVDA